MKKKNPMFDAAIRAKAHAAMKDKWKLKLVRAGNGKFTIPQILLWVQLGDGWVMELPVSTECKIPKKQRFHSYKVDIGNPLLKLAIEVDGHSHYSRKQQQIDTWKTARLQDAGWTVLRFWNKQVTGHLGDCVETVMFTTSKLKKTTITLPTVS